MLGSRLAAQRHRRHPDFGLAQVNIVLLLVLFFLVVGTIVENDELAIDLSETTELPLERLPRPLLLITPAGGWALDGAPMGESAILEALQAPPPEGQPNAVYILASRDMAADRLLKTMQMLLPSGRTVKLVTLKAGGPG